MRNNRQLFLAFLIFIPFLIVENIILIHFLRHRPEKIKKSSVAETTEIKAPVPVPKAQEPAAECKGRIAIVLDDWGYNKNNLALVKEIDYPLTMAILPNLGYSNILAGEFKNSGFEVILHLPMEPKENLRLERETIMTSMKEAVINNIIEKDLKNVLYAGGVSNHMGSKATTDERTMRVVFRELKKRGLYFLDSYVLAESVCADIAEETGIAFARRDIFLDNESEFEYIKSQMEKLKETARLYGEAVGIGHDRQLTIKVLREMMPLFEKQGYKFVFVSDLTY